MIRGLRQGVAHHRTAVLVVGALVAAVVVGLVTLRDDSSPAAPPPIPVGFNNNAIAQGVASPDEAADLISDAGGTIDRLQIDWVTLEPARGEYNWHPYDEIYAADLDRGINPLLNFAYAPEWANGGVCPDTNTGCHAPPTPEHYADAAETAAAIAARYPEAAGIEIWNEPNTPYFWVPAADPTAYAALLSACKAMIERVAPDMPVVGASLASSPGEEQGSFRAPDFLRRLYDVGVPDPMDAISVHPYPEPGDVTGETATAVVEDVREVRDAAGDEATPLWVTETGATTTGPYAISEEEQGATLLALYDGLLDQPDVEMILVHTLVQPPRSPADLETGFGVVHQDLSPTPAFCGLSERWGGEGC